MDIEKLRHYCLAKKCVIEEFPFDETTLVFKVCGKMFVLTDIEDDFYINLKCDPDKAIQLRADYPENVMPGYHMNKKHWNTIRFNHLISDQLIREWIDHSYELVVKKLPAKDRKKIMEGYIKGFTE